MVARGREHDGVNDEHIFKHPKDESKEKQNADIESSSIQLQITLWLGQ